MDFLSFCAFCVPCGILTQRHKCTLKMHIRGLQQKHKSSFACENIEICREISPDRVRPLPYPPLSHPDGQRTSFSDNFTKKKLKKQQKNGKIVNTQNGKSKNPFGHCQLSAFDRDKGKGVLQTPFPFPYCSFQEQKKDEPESEPEQWQDPLRFCVFVCNKTEI